MLMGEHAILHNQPALVAAIDQRIHVALTSLPTPHLQITSSLGHYQAPLYQLTPSQPLRFVLSCVQAMQPHLDHGLHIQITSAIDPTIGFGSSAALTVALSGALAQWCHQTFNPEQHLQQARHIIQQVQGCGSGADAAASIYGGIVHYYMQPLYIECIDTHIAIASIYCGYKTPTNAVIAQIAQLASQQPARYQTLYQAMGTTTRQAITALRHQNYPALAQAMATYQQHLRDLGVSDTTLEALITELSQQPNVLAAKISGSGLGDCVIALLQSCNTQLQCQQGRLSSVKITTNGYRVEHQHE